MKVLLCQDQDGDVADDVAPLGGVAHMIRGQLGGFQQLTLTGRAFSQCTACSPTVVDAWRHRGWPFVAEALRVRPAPRPCPATVLINTMICYTASGCNNWSHHWRRQMAKS